MQKVQKGFTLIELVVVIVLLGILGVTALGRFQDLSGDAREAAVNGIASEISAAAAVNYAAGTLGTPGVPVRSAGAGIVADGSADACLESGLDDLFNSGSMPAGYSVNVNNSADCTAAGITFECTIVDDDDATATATATIVCTGT